MAADPRPMAADHAEALAADVIRSLCTDLGVDLAAAPQGKLKRGIAGVAAALRSAHRLGIEDAQKADVRAHREGSPN